MREWISRMHAIGSSRPGIAGVPVMKSLVRKARIPIERAPLTPKSTGKSVTGHCERDRSSPYLTSA